jgi:biopolymer transport protein ExbD
MADKQRFLDIWIVESNTVYKEVPFNVVTDWVQQGRLLEDDQAKPSGTKEWQRIRDMGEFQPYFHQPEPFRPQDSAEALGAVSLDVSVKRSAEAEDDDVDMIPLIDVSLVLLVFFMLTATSVAVTTVVKTPEADYGLLADNPSALRIDIRLDPEGVVLYSLGVGDKAPGPDESDLQNVSAVLDRLKVRLDRAAGVDLVINAQKDLKAKVARDLLVALRKEPFRSKITLNYFGVTESPPP